MNNLGQKIKRIFNNSLIKVKEISWIKKLISILIALILGIFYLYNFKRINEVLFNPTVRDYLIKVLTWVGTPTFLVGLTTFVWNIKRENKQKRELLFDADIPNFLAHYDRTEFFRKNKSLFKPKKIEETYESTYIETLREGQELLRKIYRMYIAPTSLKSFKKADKYLDEKDNISLIITVINDLINKFENPNRLSWIKNDSVVTLMLEEFPDKQDSNQCTESDHASAEKSDIVRKKLKVLPDELLIVRTIPTSDLVDFLGDWRISDNNAKKIKYLIGVSGYVNSDKTFEGIIKVKSRKSIGQRIRFYGNSMMDKKEYSDKIKEIKETIEYLIVCQKGKIPENSTIEKDVEELLSSSGWKGINPTVYLNNFEK